MMEAKNKLSNLLDQMGRGSRVRLAEYLGVPRNYITRWEKYDAYKLPVDKLAKIAKFFGVSTDYLLDDDQMMPVVRSVPVIGNASCGVPTEHFATHDDGVPIPSNLYDRHVYAVRAEGDSMEPKISEGDIVVCNPDVDVKAGDIVHYTINGESGIKIYEQSGDLLKLSSINSKYAPIYYRDDEIETFSIAKCVYLVSRL